MINPNTSSPDLNTLIDVAVTIAEHNQETGLTTPYPNKAYICPTAIQLTIDQALDGAVSSPSPRMWAVLVDAQEASRLLTLADENQAIGHSFQASDYRHFANRKLAEAVSWLV